MLTLECLLNPLKRIHQWWTAADHLLEETPGVEAGGLLSLSLNGKVASTRPGQRPMSTEDFRLGGSEPEQKQPLGGYPDLVVLPVTLTWCGNSNTIDLREPKILEGSDVELLDGHPPVKADVI